ncbi:MAG: YobA family protein [Oscillospiraceae bacterium]|jgi:hypothetical protein|nr:YobA family protein [Oscillospiraceae bacterium]
MQFKLKFKVISAVTLIVSLLIASLALMNSCTGGDEPQPPLTSGEVVVTSGSEIPKGITPDIKGRITSISMLPDGAIALVEGDNKDNPDIKYQKAYVRLDLKTAIGTDTDDKLIDRLKLSAGDRVEVWFSGVVAETFPVQAYAQAVRLITVPEEDIAGIKNLPQMKIYNGGASMLAAVSQVYWHDLDVRIGTAAEVLKDNYGAKFSVRAGESISLSFNMPPDGYTVSYRAENSDSSAINLPTENDRITIPADLEGNIIFTVNANWEDDSISYVFSVFVFK